MVKIKYLISFGLLLMPIVSGAYEVLTHEKLSGEALNITVLAESDLLQDMGLVNGITSGQSFGDAIADGTKQTIQVYIQKGANFEDNNTRPLNHFYDPYHDIGLSGFPPGIKSPNWALEDNELLDLPEQEFSINDASDYFYRALTGKDLPLGETRVTNFGKLFLTLGHVIHHVQDMAQPQHVRDDPHCGEAFCHGFEKYLGLSVFNPSFFKKISGMEITQHEWTFYDI